MFPWLWIFAPTTYWPLSGAVSQDLTPEAFFRGIRPGAGVPGIEKQVFEQASYGKQLGWLIDPSKRRIYVYRPDEEVIVLDNPESVSGDPLLPGFILETAELW